MLKKLPRFVVRLGLVGLQEELQETIMRELREELLMREYYTNPHVFWNAELKDVIVEINTEGVDKEQVAKQSLEELFEILPSILPTTEGIHFEVLNVERL